MARVARSEEDRLIIAYNIKKRRKDNYGSSGQCAEAFKVPHSQWSPWESARRTPDPERMDKIAAFFKCEAKDLLTPPENWKEEKARFLQERDKASKGKKNAPIPEPEVKQAPEPVKDDDGAADYISIVTMLAKVQSRYDKGEIPQEQFAAKMQSIREFVTYSYQGLMAASNS
jgi:transcriptional regulator with XRE-family HTH domain